MAGTIVHRLMDYGPSTFEAVTAILDAEDGLMAAFRHGDLSWDGYIAARDRLDRATDLTVTNAQAADAARQMLAWVCELKKVEAPTC